MSIPTQFYRDIERAVRRGMSLTEIEETVLKPMRLGTELMSVLWLYAWGLRQRASRPGGASGKRYELHHQDEV